MNKPQMKRGKTLPIVYTFFFLVVFMAVGLAGVAAEPVNQPVQPTPSADVTETPEPSLSTVAPAPTSEIDPAAFLLEDGWDHPLNLSKSGATSGSQIVTDSQGTSHVLWLDELEGFGYTAGMGDQWKIPESPEFPFYTRRYFPDLQDVEATPRFIPILAADGRGQIFAFWIGESEELYYSSVLATLFNDYNAWTPRASLTDSALTLAAATGLDGSIHLIFIRPQDSESRPSGIYYQQLDTSGTWQNPSLLYASRYLRSVSPDVANIRIWASDSDNIFAAWDDTLKQQIFFTGSSDNGRSWNPVQEIDRRLREDSESAAGPAGITVGAHEGQLHLTWRGGHEPEASCSQYITVSNDGGENWTGHSPILSLPTCFTKSQFIVAGDTLFLLGIIEEEGVEMNSTISTAYLLAWDGTQWSEPQIQDPLFGFSNPETNQLVRLGCLHGEGTGIEITIVGCDTADGGDTWLLSREVGTIEEWFPPPPIWQGPNEISNSGSIPVETQLVSGEDGTIHNFWNDENSPRIFHAQWDGVNWSNGQEIIRSLEGNVITFAVASANERLYLAWHDSALGIQFSEASLSNPSQWTDPVSPVDSRLSASSPSIVADAGGNVFLAFVEQLNESRGVYLVHSADEGDTWSSPIQVFDGAAAGWDMVDKPVLTRTENGQLHLMWTRSSLPPESMPLGLAYSRSEDLGQSWSDVAIVVEAESYWNELAGSGERFVHRFWTEINAGRDGVWHSYSLDGGLTWGPAEQIIRFTNRSGVAAVIDAAGRPQLLAIEAGRLTNLVWDGEAWIEEVGLETDLNDNGSLSAATNLAGGLFASYVDILPTEGDANGERRLYSMSRSLDLPAQPATPLPPLTPTQPPPTAQSTETPAPTPTVFFPTEQEQSGLGEIPGMGGLPFGMDFIVSFLPVLLILGIGLFIGIRIIRRR